MKAGEPRPNEGDTRRDALVKRISHVLAAIAGATLLVLLLVNIIQIVARPLMGGLIWVNDLSRLLISWVVMVGASAGIGLREHLIVDFIVERSPAAFRVFSAYGVRLLEIGSGLILLVSGLVVAMERMNIQYVQLGIPTGYAYLAVPVLGFFMVMFGLLMSVRSPETSTVGEDEGGELR